MHAHDGDHMIEYEQKNGLRNLAPFCCLHGGNWSAWPGWGAVLTLTAVWHQNTLLKWDVWGGRLIHWHSNWIPIALTYLWLLGFLFLLKSLVPWPHHPGPPRLAKRTEMRKGKQMVVQPLAVICSRLFWDLFRLYIYIIIDYNIHIYIYIEYCRCCFLEGYSGV